VEFDEVRWVLRAQAGHLAAQEVLFRRHLAPLRQRVYRLLGPDAEIDDVVQEAFLRAFEGISRLAEPRAFGAWLSTIAVHLADRRLRRRRLLRRLGFVPSDDRNDATQAVASPAVSPAVAAEARVVYSMLDRLPTEARVAFLLARVEGMTVPEVAAQMALSERTVKRRIALAEASLASVLEVDREARQGMDTGEGNF
jgi:RNA polymerase sigma-70 factor (ECF subfamily)